MPIRYYDRYLFSKILLIHQILLFLKKYNSLSKAFGPDELIVCTRIKATGDETLRFV